MADEPTCGQGLARHAELPQLIADLIDSLADKLRAHVPALVSSDTNSQEERPVYEQLAASHREAAARLRAIGADMAAQQDLSMGDHDLDAMSTSQVTNRCQGSPKLPQSSTFKLIVGLG